MTHSNRLPPGRPLIDGTTPTLADKLARELADKSGKRVDALTKSEWQAIAQALSYSVEEQLARNAASRSLTLDELAEYAHLLEKDVRRKLAKGAANAKHATARAKKQKALHLYQSGSYPSIAEAARHIAKKVNQSPTTVDNWIRDFRRSARKVS